MESTDRVNTTQEQAVETCPVPAEGEASTLKDAQTEWQFFQDYWPNRNYAVPQVKQDSMGALAIRTQAEFRGTLKLNNRRRGSSRTIYNV